MKYLITFSYDGSKYFGYQKQPNKPTVQQEIENVLTQLNSNKPVIISASGRTDSGVHALNQKAHFVLDKEYDESKLQYSMNKMLSTSIYIKNVEKKEDNFHARFDVKKKKYTYKINVGEYNPLEYNYIFQNNYISYSHHKYQFQNFQIHFQILYQMKYHRSYRNY